MEPSAHQERRRGTPQAAVETCTRCSHQRHEPPGTSERLRRLVGMKPRRVTCGEPTELGPCPCRSRFHVR